MKLTLDDENIDVQLEGKETLSEVLGKIEDEISKFDATIIEVRLNGKSVKMGEFDEVLQRPAEKAGNVDLVSISADELFALLREMKPALLRLCERLSNLGAKFQTGEKGEIAATIADLSKNLQNLFNVFSYCSLFPARFASKKIGDKGFLEFAGDLSACLQEFLDAYQNEDFVSVGDIAEYEIVPRLQSLQDSIG